MPPHFRPKLIFFCRFGEMLSETCSRVVVTDRAGGTGATETAAAIRPTLLPRAIRNANAGVTFIIPRIAPAVRSEYGADAGSVEGAEHRGADEIQAAVIGNRAFFVPGLGGAEDLVNLAFVLTRSGEFPTG